MQSQGSFTVGGDIVFSDALGTGGSGHIAVNQMYVQYKVPPSGRVPVVMVHGADLSGKSYETTPDGRMGWEEYFVRKGHAVFLPDQVSRARSGFDPTVFNRRSSGQQPGHGSQIPANPKSGGYAGATGELLLYRRAADRQDAEQ